MLPVMRDPDGFIYYKEEVGGLVMGGFEPDAKPWTVDPIPSTFEFQLLGEDWDQFEVLMTNAIHRTPCLETAEMKMLLNGPESFTPDGNFILGEAPEPRGCFVGAGFNSAGIANSGGAGGAPFDRRMDRGGQAPRPGTSTCAASAPSRPTARRLAERTAETLGQVCTTRCVGRARSCAARGRCARRRCTTCSMPKALSGAARTAGSAPTTSSQPARRGAEQGLGTPGWLPWLQAEQPATREAVAL